MWKCTGKLGRADDLHLKEVEYPQQEYTDLIQCLKECLEDFLVWDIRGICIAVICGAEGPSYPNDSLSLLETTMKIARYVSQGKYIKRDGQVASVLTNEYVCIAIRHDGGDNLNAMFGNLYAGIGKILKDISEDTVPVDGNESEVKEARVAVSTMANYFSLCPPDLYNEGNARFINQSLGGSCVLDHFPRVKILVFMPTNAYEIFGVSENLFFKQIHSVIRIEDPGRVVLTRAEYESMKMQLEAAQEEAAATNAQREAAQKEAAAANAQLDAAQQISAAEKEKLSAQRDAAEAKVGELTEQVNDLTALVKELQSKLTPMVLGHSLLENGDLQTESMEEPTATIELMKETELFVAHLVQLVSTDKINKSINSDKSNAQETPTVNDKNKEKTQEGERAPSIDKDDSHNSINDGKSNVERERDHDYDEGRGRD